MRLNDVRLNSMRLDSTRLNGVPSIGIRLNSARLNSALRSWAKILPYRLQVCQVKIAKFHKKNFLSGLSK